MGDAFPGPGGNQTQITKLLVNGAEKRAGRFSEIGRKLAQAHGLFPRHLDLASYQAVRAVERGPLALGALCPGKMRIFASSS